MSGFFAILGEKYVAILNLKRCWCQETKSAIYYAPSFELRFLQMRFVAHKDNQNHAIELRIRVSKDWHLLYPYEVSRD